MTMTGSASQTEVASGFATGSASGTGSSPSASSSGTSGAGHVEVAGGMLAVVAAGFGLFM